MSWLWWIVLQWTCGCVCLGKLFYKGPDSKYFILSEPYILSKLFCSVLVVGKQPQTICKWVNMIVINITLFMHPETFFVSFPCHQLFFFFFRPFDKPYLADGLFKNRLWCWIWYMDCNFPISDLLCCLSSSSHHFMCHFVTIQPSVGLSTNDRVKVSSGSECQLELLRMTCMLYVLKSSLRWALLFLFYRW